MTEMKLADYLVLIGLCELVKDCRRKHDDLESAIGDLLDEKADEGGYRGHVSDAMFEENPAAYIMRHLKLKAPAKAPVPEIQSHDG